MSDHLIQKLPLDKGLKIESFIEKHRISITLKKNSGKTLSKIHKVSFPRHWTESYFNSLIDHPNYKIFSASNENTIGFLIILTTKDISEIITFAILPQMRRQGIGKALLTKSIEWLISKNFSYCNLEVSAENIIAQKLYKTLGFIQVGIRKNYYKSQIQRFDALLYTKKLK